MIWKDGVLKRKEEEELAKNLEVQLDWVKLEDNLLTTSNKRSIEEVNEISVDTFVTVAYRIKK